MRSSKKKKIKANVIITESQNQEIIKLWLTLENNSDINIATITNLPEQLVGRKIRVYLKEKFKNNPNI